MNKRAISAVVATTLIILITVMAVSIIWASIVPMVRENVADDRFIIYEKQCHNETTKNVVGFSDTIHESYYFETTMNPQANMNNGNELRGYDINERFGLRYIYSTSYSSHIWIENISAERLDVDKGWVKYYGLLNRDTPLGDSYDEGSLSGVFISNPSTDFVRVKMIIMLDYETPEFEYNTTQICEDVEVPEIVLDRYGKKYLCSTENIGWTIELNPGMDIDTDCELIREEGQTTITKLDLLTATNWLNDNCQCAEEDMCRKYPCTQQEDGSFKPIPGYCKKYVCGSYKVVDKW